MHIGIFAKLIIITTAEKRPQGALWYNTLLYRCRFSSSVHVSVIVFGIFM